MTARELALQTALARVIGQVRGAGLHDRVGHTFTRNAAVSDAERLLTEFGTPAALFRYPVGPVPPMKAVAEEER